MADITAPERATYQGDFHAWLNEQGAALRGRRLYDLDFGNLAEEVEDLGHSKRDALESRLAVLLLHLLKWRFQPARRGSSWRKSISEQRRAAERLMRRNPSLRPAAEALLADAYAKAVLRAERETGLPEATFPPHCIWRLPQALDANFWPDGAA